MTGSRRVPVRPGAPRSTVDRPAAVSDPAHAVAGAVFLSTDMWSSLFAGDARSNISVSYTGATQTPRPTRIGRTRARAHARLAPRWRWCTVRSCRSFPVALCTDARALLPHHPTHLLPPRPTPSHPLPPPGPGQLKRQGPQASIMRTNACTRTLGAVVVAGVCWPTPVDARVLGANS